MDSKTAFRARLAYLVPSKCQQIALLLAYVGPAGAVVDDAAGESRAAVDVLEDVEFELGRHEKSSTRHHCCWRHLLQHFCLEVLRNEKGADFGGAAFLREGMTL